MKYPELLLIAGKEPAFRSGLLAAQASDPVDLGRQLSRWVKSGRLIRLRRGVYALPEGFRKSRLHPFLAANLMKSASYVSLQSALEYHGLVPDHSGSVTCVTTGRPEYLSNPVGSFLFRHIQTKCFFGYRRFDLGRGQSAFVACPEKALLDLLYLTPGSHDPDFLFELRLQNLASVNMEALDMMASQMGRLRLREACDWIARIRKREKA